MREKVIEAALVRAVKKRNGMAMKFQSVNLAGVPDRIVLLPGAVIAFVELKAPGKKMRPLQEKRKAQLQELGFFVFCVDSLDRIEVVLNELQAI